MLIAIYQGIPTDTVLTGAVLAALPGVVGGFLPTAEKHDSGPLPAILVTLWTIFAIFIVAVTGGATSPLLGALLIAPAAAAALRQNGLTIFATLAAVLIFVTFLVSERFLTVPELTMDGAILSAPFELTTLLMVGGLLWASLEAVSDEEAAADAVGLTKAVLADPDEPDPEPVSVAPVASIVPAAPATTSAHLLADDGGILALDIAKEGRLRHVEGDVMGLVTLQPGRALGEIFTEDTDVYPLLSKSGYRGQMTLVNDRVVDVTARPSGEGYLVMLREKAQDDEPQSEFFAVLGHELKTSLNAIIGYADMMRAEIKGPLPEAYKDYPDIISESGNELLLMVEDMLDYSKSKASNFKLDLEPVNLHDSAKAVIRQLTAIATRQKVELKLKGNPDVWAFADARAVRQIWQNLVSNAIKYSHPGSEVVLNTGLYGGRAMLSVRDSGEGLTPEDLAHIKDPYKMGGNSKGKIGTGLGLAVVVRFAELMHGNFDIASEVGRGTLATVHIPLADISDLEVLGEAAE